MKNTGTWVLSVLDGSVEKYSLPVGETGEQQLDPPTDRYTVKADQTVIAEILYTPDGSFQVIKKDTLYGAEFRTIADLTTN